MWDDERREKGKELKIRTKKVEKKEGMTAQSKRKIRKG